MDEIFKFYQKETKNAREESKVPSTKQQGGKAQCVFVNIKVNQSLV